MRCRLAAVQETLEENWSSSWWIINGVIYISDSNEGQQADVLISGQTQGFIDQLSCGHFIRLRRQETEVMTRVGRGVITEMFYVF